MDKHENKKNALHTDEEEQNEEFAQDEEIGEPDYFSTCDFTMIGDEDGLIDYQGS